MKTKVLVCAFILLAISKMVRSQPSNLIVPEKIEKCGHGYCIDGIKIRNFEPFLKRFPESDKEYTRFVRANTVEVVFLATTLTAMAVAVEQKIQQGSSRNFMYYGIAPVVGMSCFNFFGKKHLKRAIDFYNAHVNYQ
jgi:hypothetical protein